jgi:Flp pilus assembly protein TadG
MAGDRGRRAGGARQLVHGLFWMRRTMAFKADVAGKRSSWLRLREGRLSWRRRQDRGQAMVEFALLSGLIAIVLFVGVQLAIIGNAQLSVSQLAYSLARYASVNPTQSDLSGQIANFGSPTITSTAGNQQLAITSFTQCPTTNGMGSPTKVTVQYTFGSMIFLPNPFLGVIKFPTSVSSSQSAYCEGSG